jgi:hypothetical protein
VLTFTRSHIMIVHCSFTFWMIRVEQFAELIELLPVLLFEKLRCSTALFP